MSLYQKGGLMAAQDLARPGRPFGISVAVALSLTIFVMVPLVELIFLLAVTGIRVQEEAGVLAGTNSAALPMPLICAQGGLAGGFLILALLAWRGNPRWVGFAYPLAVVAYSAVLLFVRLLPSLTTSPTLSGGIDSFDSAQRIIDWILVGIVLFLLIYTPWFFNRWSARAYFRGAYLQSDLDQLAAMGISTPPVEAPAAPRISRKG